MTPWPPAGSEADKRLQEEIKKFPTTEFTTGCTPEEAGFDSERLENMTRLMQFWCASGRMPLAGTLAASNNKIFYHKAIGHMHPNELPVENMMWPIFSMTKAVTSTLIMRLVEQGIIMLEHPIHLFLGDSWKKENLKVLKPGATYEEPEFEPCKKTIFVYHLLCHTAGLSYPGGQFNDSEENQVAKFYDDWSQLGSFEERMDLQQDEDAEVAPEGEAKAEGEEAAEEPPQMLLEDVVEELAELPLVCQPGERWHYGYNITLVGRIIEVVTGMPWQEYLRKEFLEPCGMEDTNFEINEKDYWRFATLWDAHWKNQGLCRSMREEIREAGGWQNVKYSDPGGGLISTAVDYWKFIQMLANGGYSVSGKKVLGWGTCQFLFQNHLPDGHTMETFVFPSNADFALPGVGWSPGNFTISVAPINAKHYFGVNEPGCCTWGGAAGTVWIIDPVNNLAIVFYASVIDLDQWELRLRSYLTTMIFGACTRIPLRPLSWNTTTTLNRLGYTEMEPLQKQVDKIEEKVDKLLARL